MRILINAEKKRVVLQDHETFKMIYQLNQEQLKNAEFFIKWMNVLDTIQKNESARRNWHIHL